MQLEKMMCSSLLYEVGMKVGLTAIRDPEVSMSIPNILKHNTSSAAERNLSNSCRKKFVKFQSTAVNIIKKSKHYIT